MGWLVHNVTMKLMIHKMTVPVMNLIFMKIAGHLMVIAAMRMKYLKISPMMTGENTVILAMEILQPRNHFLQNGENRRLNRLRKSVGYIV